MRKVLQSVRANLLQPTPKQLESYGRWAHNLSAAATIGAVTLAYSGARYGASEVRMLEVAALVFWAILLFISGGLLSRGE